MSRVGDRAHDQHTNLCFGISGFPGRGHFKHLLCFQSYLLTSSLNLMDATIASKMGLPDSVQLFLRVPWLDIPRPKIIKSFTGEIATAFPAMGSLRKFPVKSMAMPFIPSMVTS